MSEYIDIAGWIKINRRIKQHWLWQDAEKLKWWLDMLMLANWEPKRQLLKAHIVIVERGQMVASAVTLSQRWNCSRPTVIKFLSMLENDNMILRQTLYGSISIITICNYEKYQSPIDSSVDSTFDSSVDTNLKNINNNIKEGKELLSFSKESNKEAREKKSRSQKKYSDEERKLHSDCRAIFEEKFQQLNNEKYYWTAKDAGALVGVLKQIRFFMPEEKRGDIAELTNNFRIFLDVIIRRADSFTLKKFSLPYINGNFNEIYNAIKDNNGKSANNSSTGGFGYSATELADVLANLQS